MSNKTLDLDEYLWLVEGGVSPEQAAIRCGVTLSAVAKKARRAGRVAVAQAAEAARSAARHYGTAA